LNYFLAILTIFYSYPLIHLFKTYSQEKNLPATKMLPGMLSVSLYVKC
jgi:hypothetical protein